MTRTPNYDLSQYEAEDRVTRESFNADNAAVDTALKAVADAASAKAEIVTGYYTGDGATYRTITLGFKPTAIYVCRNDGATTASVSSAVWRHYGGLALFNDNVFTKNRRAVVLQAVPTGFMVYPQCG